MKALVKEKPEKGLTLKEMPKPECDQSQVLIKVTKASICGTDLNIYNWEAWSQKNVSCPSIIGHEFVGIVEEIGQNVTTCRIGDRVSAEGHITCGTCKNCLEGNRHLCPATRGIGYHLPGCFAEYITVPQNNIFKIPKKIPDEQAAIMDALGNATFTALSCDLVGENVLITGAGPIGCMAVAICRFAGAKNVVITDVNDYRLSLAKKVGADLAINVATESLEEALHQVKGGFQSGLEMSGTEEGINTLLKNISMGGTVALLGILPPNTLIDWNDVVFKVLTLKGIWGRKIFNTWHKMTGMIEGGMDISTLITHSYHYTDYEDAFNCLLSGKAGKVILDWGSK